MADELENALVERVSRLRRIGSDTAGVEVKAAAGGLPSTMGETLSAFANGSGGLVILGLSESAGFAPTPGFHATVIRDALARLCHDEIEPPIRSDIEIVPFEGASVVITEVPPLDPMRRPSHIKRKGPYEGSFTRSGDGGRHLTAYEVSQFLSNRTQPRDDIDVVTDANLEDLDTTAVSAFLQRLRQAPNRAFRDMSDERALIRTRVVVAAPDGIIRPTLAGLLCLGTYPQQFLPQLFVSFVVLPGLALGDAMEDGTRFLDNVTCEGTITQMLDEVLIVARRNMRTAAVIRGGGREDRYDYPIEVIRELVVNALLHRDYSPQARGMHVQVELYPNRLVVKSPGGLFGDVIPSQLGVEEVSSTRNAWLARILSDLVHTDGTLISENRGSGLPAVMASLRRAGMTPPNFDVTPGHVSVTVPQHALLDPGTIAWIDSLHKPDLTDEQHIALALIHTTGSVSNEMLRAWGVETHVATAALRGLVDRGLATKRGGRRYATYELSEDQQGNGGILFHGLFPRPAVSATPASPPKLTGLSRTDASLQAVVEAIRSGATTTTAICQRLSLSYATATRRINSLLRNGRIGQTAPPHSRARTFFVLDDTGIGH